jgi:hypothetical protein
MAAKKNHGARQDAPKNTSRADARIDRGSRAQSTCTCDDHRGIPRDAEGNPIYLILPNVIRIKYERLITACERAWIQTGDPLAYVEATGWAFAHRQPLPTWVFHAIVKTGAELRTPQQAKTALLRNIHFMRYRAVRDIMYDMARRADGRLQLVARHDSKGRRVSQQKAFEAVAEIDGCEWSAIKRSYKQVRADLDNGYAGRYHFMKLPQLKTLPAR